MKSLFKNGFIERNDVDEVFRIPQLSRDLRGRFSHPRL